MREVLGDEHLFEPWVPFRDNPATAAALATEASEQGSRFKFIYRVTMQISDLVGLFRFESSF